MMAISSLYRGWWVLAGLFVVYAASNGILVHSLPLLYPEMIREFGWSEAQVTLPATVFYVVSAFTSPPAGVLLDRYSARRIIACGAAGMVLCLLAYGFVTELWQLVLLYALIGVSLSLGGLVSNMVVLSRWFDRIRGRAIGILLMASSLGGVVFPLVMGRGIEAMGWRPTVWLLAGIAAVMLFLPLFFLVRNRPEELGLAPDGAAVANTEGRPPIPRGVSLKEALRGRNFYLLALATAAVWFSMIALTQHQSIHLGRDLGVPGPALATIFSVFFAASVIGKFGFGFLGDHFRKDRVMIGSIGVLIAGLLLLRWADGDNMASLYAYAVVAGIGFSGAFTSIQVLLARFYAGQSYGKILAVLILIDTLAGALGTRVVALVREQSPDYLSAIDLMIGVCVAAMLCLMLVRFNQLVAAPAAAAPEAT